jgi:hypothetical protein
MADSARVVAKLRMVAVAAQALRPLYRSTQSSETCAVSAPLEVPPLRGADQKRRDPRTLAPPERGARLRVGADTLSDKGVASCDGYVGAEANRGLR